MSGMPSDRQSYQIEAEYLRRMAANARERQQQSGGRFNTITGGEHLFEQAARMKDSYAASPNSAPQNPMTPGIMNMMLSAIGDPQHVAGMMGGGFAGQMKEYAQTTPSFNMQKGGHLEDPERAMARENQDIAQDEFEWNRPRLQRALQDPYNPGQRVYDLGQQYHQQARQLGYSGLQNGLGSIRQPPQAPAMMPQQQSMFGFNYQNGLGRGGLFA